MNILVKRGFNREESSMVKAYYASDIELEKHYFYFE
jgi:hypothetical protein